MKHRSNGTSVFAILAAQQQLGLMADLENSSCNAAIILIPIERNSRRQQEQNLVILGMVNSLGCQFNMFRIPG